MGKKKNKKKHKDYKISVADYIKAVKRADREIQLEQQPGWQRTTNIHRSSKTYNRKDNKKNFWDEE